MNLLNFFKKKTQNDGFNHEMCQKIHERGQELTALLHPQIGDLLSKYYTKEISSNHFIEKKADSKDVFEIACVGLSLINLIDLVEKSDGNSEEVKRCLKVFQEIYIEINKNIIYNSLLKYLQDYKYFTDSEASKQIKNKDIINTCFTGAWVTRYYIGEEATIQFDSSVEIGKIIQETIQDVWVIKK